MICCQHTVGLTNLETGALVVNDPRFAHRRAAAIAAITARWAAITHEGILRARHLLPPQPHPLMPGRSFPFDDIADDAGYVFLETVPGVVASALSREAIWGWQFDAEHLVRIGAFVCDADLGGNFDDIIWNVCANVAQRLPRLPRPSLTELRDDPLLQGEEDAMLIAIADTATDPTERLHHALCRGEPDDEIGAAIIADTRHQAAAACHAFKAQRRVTGQPAIALLRSGVRCEILVSDQLLLTGAVAEVRGGVVHER